MSTIIEKVTKNTDTVSFYTLSDSVYHEGERLSSILS
jgi:beta-galactosidase